MTIAVIPNDHHLENDDGYDDVDDKVKNQATHYSGWGNGGYGNQYRRG